MSSRKCARMADLVSLLMTKVISFYMHERLLKQARRTSCQRCKAAEARQHHVQQLTEDVEVLDASSGKALVPSFSSPRAAPHACCVGDLSCDCPENRHGICQHLEACQQHVALDTHLRTTSATQLVEKNMVRIVAWQRAFARPIISVIQQRGPLCHSS